MPPAVRTVRLPIFAALLGLAVTGPVRAQQTVAIVPVTVGDTPNEAVTASLAAVRLALRERVTLLSADESATRFEQRHSSDPVILTPDDIQRLRHLANSALLDIAAGDFVQARQALDIIDEVRQRAPEALNREHTFAQIAFDACLLRVRLLYESLPRRRKPNAIEQERGKELALECTRAFPGISPGEWQTDDSRDAFQAALWEIHDTPTATVITLTPNDADHDSCPLRVNGQLFGTTSRETPEGYLFQGPAHIQIECDNQPGRVHIVELTPGQNTFLADPAFDSVVHARPEPSLHYDTFSQMHERVLADASRIATILRTESIILVRVDDQRGNIWLDRINDRHATASVRVAAGGNIRHAVQSLLDNHSVDMTGDTAEPVLPLGASPDTPPDPPPIRESRARLQTRWLSATGATLIAIAPALIAPAIWARRHDRTCFEFDAWGDDYACTSWYAYHSRHKVKFGVGGALGVAGIALGIFGILSEEQPAIGYVAAGTQAGLSLGLLWAASIELDRIREGDQTDSCTTRPCMPVPITKGAQERALLATGVILGVSAVATLGITWWRDRRGPSGRTEHANLRLRIAPLALHLEGEF